MLLKRGVAAAMFFVARAALAAPTKGECIDADTAGQAHRQQGHLLAARAELTTCASLSCPEMIRADCRDRLAEITRALPSIEVAANVTGPGFLTLDGASIPLDGLVDADPGAHELTLTVPGHAPVTEHVELKEGDKRHRVAFPPMVAIVSREPITPNSKSDGLGALRIAGIGTGVAGVVALGFGIGFGVASFGAWSTAKSECADTATCNLSSAIADRSRAYDLATASDVAFVVAGVLVATGVTMFVFGGHATVTASSDRVAFTVGGSF
jgi:hypothetical protein